MVPLVRGSRAQLSSVCTYIASNCRNGVRGEPFGNPDIFRRSILAQARSSHRPGPRRGDLGSHHQAVEALPLTLPVETQNPGGETVLAVG